MDEVKTIAADEKSRDIKVSVVVYVHNSPNYVRKCISSLAEQTLEDIEIVCVNDGSEGNMDEWLAEFGEDIENFVVINKKHTGYGESLNLAVEKCSGEYIGFVHGDDLVDKEMYEKLYESSADGEADIVKCAFSEYYDDGMKAPTSKKNKDREFIETSSKPFDPKDDSQIFWGDPSVQAAIYKKDFLTKNGIKFMELEGNKFVDEPFFTETMCRAENVMWVNEYLYYRRSWESELYNELNERPAIIADRFMDDLEILKKETIGDIKLKRRVYSKLLIYIRRTIELEGYEKNAKETDERIKELLSMIDESVITSDFSLQEQYDYFSYISPLKEIKERSPKVLIYNWLPFDNPWGWGGGVTVYCKNVISEIIRNNPDIDIYFLSSGFAYDSTTTKTYCRRIKNIFGENVKQYEIVNSPVPAEQRNLYINPLVALENENLKNTVAEFMTTYGPFDAVHFNNIEGLSHDCLDLKEAFPDTRFIFSIHNYVPLCVNGSYYMRHKHCNCSPDHTGLDCFRCTRMDIRSEIAKATYQRGVYGNKTSDCVSQGRWISAFDFERLDIDVSPDEILNFARTATAKINKNCDSILAVSQRVYDIAAENGFDESKMSVSYIGTLVAARQIGRAAAEFKGRMKLVFLGSDMNFEEKGYAFLLNALAEMPIEYAQKIDLLLTVKTPEHAEIYKMCKNFHSLKVVQGYTHDDLSWIFKGAHLSVVPVLWEDNLPQIAIESVAYGVPVLASTAGGAKELCDSELFRFECGSKEDLIAKLAHFIDKPEDLQQYWSYHHGLVTMPQHWKELSGYYGISEPDEVNLSVDEFRNLIRENDFLRRSLPLEEDSYAPKSVVEKLKKEIQKLKKENEKLKSEGGNGMKVFAGRVIFGTEFDPVQGAAGSDLFALELEDFDFDDFYAEIKFVKISNIAQSFSDTLTVSGTLLNSGDNKRTLRMHQMNWEKNIPEIRDNIYCYVRKNKVHFFGLHTGQWSGYYFEVNVLTTRAPKETSKIAGLEEEFVYDNMPLPEGAFRSL